MGVTLVMFTQNGERRDFEVRAGKKGDSDDSGAEKGKARATIGRNRECNIQIALGVVSRRHCEVTIDDGKLHVRDLGSSNGCFVNNKRVQQAELRAGDTLTIGPVVFTVVIDGNPSDVKAVRTVLERKKHKSKKSKGSHKSKSSSDESDAGEVALSSNGSSITLRKKPPKPAPKKLDETGSIDLDDMALDLEADNDVGVNPLAELEELSKQKGRSRG